MTGGLPEAVLLDQDGTVADTEPIWMSSETNLVNEHGRTWTREMGMQLVGNPLAVSARVLIDEGGLDMSVQEIVDDLLGRVSRRLHDGGVPWIDGMPDFFARLRTLAIPFALVTSSWKVVATEVATQAPHGGFDAVVAGDQVAHPKPAPDAYLLAARELNVCIARCLVIEDSPAGIAAGLASGARVVGIPSVVPIEPRPGLSRLRSVRELDAPTMRRIMAGAVLDTVDQP